jgi:hypothetical protein
MDFDLLLKRETLGSAAFATAVVFSVAAWSEVRRIATNARVKQDYQA